MRIAFLIIGALGIVLGIMTIGEATGGIHQAFGATLLVFGAIFIVGAEIINAINNIKE